MTSSRALSLSLALSTVGFAMVAGCNSLTGADGLQIADGNAGGGGGGGTGGETTTTTPPVQCTYPTTGFSTKVGGVMPNHSWQGFVNESMEATEVTMADYLDCDGSKGINALLIDVSATWCGSCQVEAQTLTSKMKQKWEALGIRVLTLMIEDAQSKPATIDTALAWKEQYNLVSTTVAADPQFFFQQLAQNGSVGLPFLITIDPRTMTLVATAEGYPGDEQTLLDLAAKNQQAQ